MACMMLTRKEVAAYLQVDKTTVDRLTKAGKLKAYRLGDRIVRYCLQEVQQEMGVKSD